MSVISRSNSASSEEFNALLEQLAAEETVTDSNERMRERIQALLAAIDTELDLRVPSRTATIQDSDIQDINAQNSDNGLLGEVDALILRTNRVIQRQGHNMNTEPVARRRCIIPQAFTTRTI